MQTITPKVELALKKLQNKNLSGIVSAKDLGDMVGYTNEEFFKFAKQADLSGDVLQQYKDYTASATTATTKFATTLKTVAANIAIMLAVTAGIKLIAFTYDQIAHRQENLNEKAAESAKVYEELQDEIDSLNDKLETTNSRIKELSKMSNLTFVEQEELRHKKIPNKAYLYK